MCKNCSLDFGPHSFVGELLPKHTFRNWQKGTYWKPGLSWGYVATWEPRRKPHPGWIEICFCCSPLFCGCHSWIEYIHRYNYIFYDVSSYTTQFNSIYVMHVSETLSTDAKMWRLFSALRRWFSQMPRGLLAFSHLGAQGVRDFGSIDVCVFWHPEPISGWLKMV